MINKIFIDSLAKAIIFLQLRNVLFSIAIIVKILSWRGKKTFTSFAKAIFNYCFVLLLLLVQWGNDAIEYFFEQKFPIIKSFTLISLIVFFVFGILTDILQLDDKSKEDISVFVCLLISILIWLAIYNPNLLLFRADLIVIIIFSLTFMSLNSFKIILGINS